MIAVLLHTPPFFFLSPLFFFFSVRRRLYVFNYERMVSDWRSLFFFLPLSLLFFSCRARSAIVGWGVFSSGATSRWWSVVPSRSDAASYSSPSPFLFSSSRSRLRFRPARHPLSPFLFFPFLVRMTRSCGAADARRGRRPPRPPLPPSPPPFFSSAMPRRAHSRWRPDNIPPFFFFSSPQGLLRPRSRLGRWTFPPHSCLSLSPLLPLV